MTLEADARKEIVNRLRRAAGQVEAVASMVDDGRSCRDVVTQLSAAARALDRAGYKLIALSMRECLMAEDGERELTPDQLERLFISLA